MKRYCFSLLALALLGGAPVFAQGQPASPGTTPTSPACTPTKTVCTPVPYTKQVAKVTYATGTDTICLCFYHGLFKGGCGCDKGHCDNPVQIRYLVKKVNYCPRDAVKCVPTEVPACGHGQGHITGMMAPASPAVVPPPAPVLSPR